MSIKVYYSEISAHKEVKKRQQKVMMILDSKSIPYEPIDITEPGKESDKDFMLTNAKPKGNSKVVLAPQVFNGETYCGDFEDFELANENDELEKFLNIAKVEKSVTNGTHNEVAAVNGTSRGSSAEKEATEEASAEVNQNQTDAIPSENPQEEATPQEVAEPQEEGIDDVEEPEETEDE